MGGGALASAPLWLYVAPTHCKQHPRKENHSSQLIHTKSNMVLVPIFFLIVNVTFIVAWPFLTHFLHSFLYLINKLKPELIFCVLLIGVNTSCKNSRKNIVIQISMFVTFHRSANDYKVLDEFTDNNNGFKRVCQIQDKKK